VTSVYTDLGLKAVINGSGKMTALGSSILDEHVTSAIAEAAQNYVNMEELISAAGKVIAENTGAEDGCPTNSASAGIVISVAALVAGKDITKIEKIPLAESKNEFILQAGHDINFGANVKQMVNLGGGKVKKAGAANKVEAEHIKKAINENTAGLIYVESHHTVQKGMVSIDDMIQISKENNIPIIIDAAAEQDLKSYIAKGADAVIYSGSKAMNGPTSGFICGKKEIIEACRKQYKGIGRAMKVNKESIIGMLTSLIRYQKNDSAQSNFKKEMEDLSDELNQLEGLTCQVIQDEAGRDIYRCEIKVNDDAGMTAKELMEKLENGNPAIYLRNHYVNTGVLFVDPRPLQKNHLQLIVQRFKEIFTD
jgi:L-seryl-tRNA(Ser) seleniumtransferase/D-glucosaminate-6-phosphate ammonia-lyase